ncbi:geranylgeranyl pyrophosphate synthase [Aeromicrobium flavum]|uniref:Geranylgeranyl pyrophosphate synthase n=1 Tax=Aeromicrobium flavum TaxID=416568 RepID=A0A512HUA1_9ACTN|nr:polyprenyl synthetase family protein [Aeromicrobium flavum]GEO88990.1 geranylgeranyl pyrophosphate synthase [Aeromicrobium flavum]
MSLQDELDSLVSPTRAPDLARDHGALLAALELGTSGGKRFRPWLVSTVHAAFEGAQAETVVDSVAAATELLHTAFVIHDDVIDNDDTRRGRPSVPGWFRADAVALDTADEDQDTYTRAGAILAGDLALAAAIRAVATCGADPQTTGRLLDLLDATLHASAAGELADVRLSLGPRMPDAEEALAVAEHKTAVYSFMLPMQAGAVLAGANDHLVEALGEIGRCLGIAFQLRDDVLSIFGDPAETGKDRLGDLREGKRTPLMVHAAQTSSWGRIAPHLGDPHLTETTAATVRGLLESCGARRHIEELADRHVEIAREQARSLGLDGSLLEPLLAHAWGVTTAATRVGAA